MTELPAALSPSEAPRRRDVWIAFVLALVALSAFAWIRDLWDADEGRYASVALDMRRTGDFVTPRENGMRFMDKPPLVYWVENGAFSVFGVNPFAARFPCLLAGAALAAIVFLLSAAWTADRAKAFCAAGIAASSLAGMGFSRTVTMDMPLAASIAGALLFGFRALGSDGWRPRVGLGACVGLGLLAKGPLGAVVPALVALAWGVVGVPWRRVASVALSPVAWGAALAVAAPWYALCERANPGYLEHFVVYEHFGRLAKKGNREFAPVWLYVPVLVAGMMPWTHLLFGARLPRPVIEGRQHAVPAGRLAWAWVVACLLFYSAGRNRLFTYILPAFAPLFVLAGARLWERLAAGGTPAMRQAWWAAMYGALSAAAAVFVASDLPYDRGWIPDERFRVMAAPAGVAALLLLTRPLIFLREKRARGRAARLLFAATAVWWFVDLAVARVDDMRSARELASVLAKERGADGEVICLDAFPQGLRFYEDLFVKVAGKQGEIVEPWASLDGRGVLLTVEELEARWASPARVLLVARQAKAAPWIERGGRAIATRLAGAQRSDLVVVENRPRGR